MDEPSRELLLRYVHGDRGAFEALFHQVERDVYLWILRIVREPAAAELARLRPDVLVKGGDYTPERVVGREVVEGYGGRVCVTAYREGASTTRLIDELWSRHAG